MAAAQSQKRFETEKAARPGLRAVSSHDSIIMMEGARASILLDWHFRQAQKHHFPV